MTHLEALDEAMTLQPKDPWWIRWAKPLAFFTIFGIILLAIAFAGEINPKPVGHPLSCARTLPGNYELVSFKLRRSGDERECHYVKRGVR